MPFHFHRSPRSELDWYFNAEIRFRTSHTLKRIKPGLKVSVSSVCLCGRCRLGNLVRVCCHIIVQLHADLAKDLLVDIFSLLVSFRITNHFELVLHHLLLHTHFFGLHGELLHNVVHLCWVHRCVHARHDRVDTLQRLNHLSVHLRGAQLRLNHSHLTCHRVIHVDLLAGPDEVLAHNLGRAVLILLRERLDLLERLCLLVLQLLLLSFDLSDCTSDRPFVLLCLFLRINFWLTISHFDYMNYF